MLITISFGKDVVKFSKATFGVYTKITTFFNDDNDKSILTPSLLEDTNIGYYVEIENLDAGMRTFNVTIDLYNKIHENDVNHKAIYENICEFLKEHVGVVSLFLDREYEVFCFKLVDKFIPYKLASRKLTTLTLPNVRTALSNLKDKTSMYIILTFGDSIKIIDDWNSYQLVYILAKSFIENRFPLLDKKKLEKSSIASFDGFFLAYVYLSNIAGAKVQFRDAVKRGYDNLSKMNMLAHIPQESWILEEGYKNIKIDRLKTVIKNEKKNLSQKIKDIIIGKDLKESEDELEYVPTYFSHIFNNASIMMNWKDFVEIFSNNELIAQKSRTPMFDETDDENSIIILPTEDIGNQEFLIQQEDILFIGLNSQTLYFALKSHTGKNKCTPEETLLAQKLDDWVLSNFYLETDIEFDDEDLRNNNQPLLLDVGG